MLIKIVSFIPEISLLLSIMVMQLVHWLRYSQTQKTFLTLSKYFILVSFVGCVIFYNFSFDERIYRNSEYTTFFKCWLLLGAIILNNLAGRFFNAQNKESCLFYQLISLQLLMCCVIISCRHLGIACGMLMAVEITDIVLAEKYKSIAYKPSLTLDIFHLFTLALLLIIGAVLLYRVCGTLGYDELKQYYQTHSVTLIDRCGINLILAGQLLVLGVVPFHSSAQRNITEGSLPTAAFSTLIIPIAVLALIITQFNFVFPEKLNSVASLLITCGILSICFGAIGSGWQKSVRQLFGCVGLFNIGIVLLMLASFNQAGIAGGMIYFMIYWLTICGVYACFYGIHSHGEYLDNFADYAGLAEGKPYLAVALLIFGVSFLGQPPFLGMLSDINMTEIFFERGNFVLLAVVFVMLIWLAHGILGLIKVLYFDKRTHNFDRVDMEIYVILSLNILLMFLIMFHSRYPLYKIKEMLSALIMQG